MDQVYHTGLPNIEFHLYPQNNLLEMLVHVWQGCQTRDPGDKSMTKLGQTLDPLRTVNLLLLDSEAEAKPKSQTCELSLAKPRDLASLQLPSTWWFRLAVWISSLDVGG